jgi:hypothetical protein
MWCFSELELYTIFVTRHNLAHKLSLPSHAVFVIGGAVEL